MKCKCCGAENAYIIHHIVCDLQADSGEGDVLTRQIMVIDPDSFEIHGTPDIEVLCQICGYPVMLHPYDEGAKGEFYNRIIETMKLGHRPIQH